MRKTSAPNHASQRSATILKPTQIDFFLFDPKMHAGRSALLVEVNAKISLRFNEFWRCIEAVALLPATLLVCWAAVAGAGTSEDCSLHRPFPMPLVVALSESIFTELLRSEAPFSSSAFSTSVSLESLFTASSASLLSTCDPVDSARRRLVVSPGLLWFLSSSPVPSSPSSLRTVPGCFCWIFSSCFKSKKQITESFNLSNRIKMRK